MTMNTLRVHDILKDRILVSRESARQLEAPLVAMLAAQKTPADASEVSPVTVDFEGVEGIAPSFLDELLQIFESLVAKKPSDDSGHLIVANPPTRLSSKFEAVARGHDMSVRALPNGSWSLTHSRSSSP